MTERTCPNCEAPVEERGIVPLTEVDDLHQRISPGEPVPEGECSVCGALVPPAFPRDISVVRGFVRHYRDAPDPDAWCSYNGLIHDPDTDENLRPHDALRQVLTAWPPAGVQVPEGEIIEIVVRRTGQRAALADDPWVLLKPHTYGPLSRYEPEVEE